MAKALQGLFVFPEDTAAEIYADGEGNGAADAAEAEVTMTRVSAMHLAGRLETFLATESADDGEFSFRVSGIVWRRE